MKAAYQWQIPSNIPTLQAVEQEMTDRIQPGQERACCNEVGQGKCKTMK